MARVGKPLLNHQTLMKALLLPLALAACLAFPETAKAQECVDSMSDWPADVDAPDPAVRFAIMDLISQYNWARDDQVSVGITDLFTSDVVYELCTAGGNIQVAMRTGPDEVATYLGDLTTFLSEHELRTRHFVSNTILHEVNSNTVQGKATILVLLQPAYPESPVLDYTATLKAEFRRGTDGAWRFRKLTLFGDTPSPGPSGARGR